MDSGRKCGSLVRKRMEERLAKIEIHLQKCDTYDLELCSNRIMNELADASRSLELLIKECRACLVKYNFELNTRGLSPTIEPLFHSSKIDVTVCDYGIVIRMDALLPFETKGFVYFLHEGLEEKVQQLKVAEDLPIFREKSALVFEHHYDAASTGYRNLRDFDNLERKCITNVVARHFLLDDSPLACISADCMVLDTEDFTVIRIMPVPKLAEYFSKQSFL